MRGRIELTIIGKVGRPPKATGRRDKKPFDTFAQAMQEAQRYIPKEGMDRNFRLEIRDKAKDYQESILFEFE